MDRTFARHRFVYTGHIYRAFLTLLRQLSNELLESSRNPSLKDAHSKDNERKEEGPLQHELVVSKLGHRRGDQTVRGRLQSCDRQAPQVHHPRSRAD
jgi:hypothetical protein